MLTRHVGANVWIAGKNVTGDLSRYIKSVTYEDVMSGETDICELELRDDERLFIGEWMPTKGDKIKLELWRESWQGDNQIETLDCGDFEIDEVQNSYPPSICKLKGNSCPSNSELRQVDESKSWENVKLSKIAQDIADAAGIELFFDASEDPDIKRAEQAEMGRMAFLEKLCRDYGLAVKFFDWLLIIFDEEKYEQQEPVSVLKYGSSTIKHFDGKTTLTEIYKSCEVKYHDGQADEVYEGKFDAPDKTEGKTLKINQRVSSKSEAEKLAKKKLREKNKEENKISVTVVGRFDYAAGSVIELQDSGFYSGRYIIEKASHKIGTGYEVTLDLRKCLEGY